MYGIGNECVPPIVMYSNVLKYSPEYLALTKKAKRETLTDAFTGAVAAFKSTPTKSPPRTHDPLQPVGVSPGRSVELRMKNFEQLRYLQQLYDDGILMTTEYEEQKEKILSILRKL